MESFLPVAILLVLSILVSAAILFLTTWLGPKHTPRTRLSAYECGVEPEGDARIALHNRFYLIAVLFLLFDVEAAFFFPWALVYRSSLKESGSSLLIAIVIYLFFVMIGLAYILKKDALELK